MLSQKNVLKTENERYVTKEEYLKVVCENEKLKTIIMQFKKHIANIQV